MASIQDWIIWDSSNFKQNDPGTLIEICNVVNNTAGCLGSICHWFGSLNEVRYKTDRYKLFFVLPVVNLWMFSNYTVYTESLHGFRGRMDKYVDKRCIGDGKIHRSMPSSGNFNISFVIEFIRIWIQALHKQEHAILFEEVSNYLSTT